MITREEFLPTRKSKVRCFILILLIVALYILDNSGLIKFIDSTTYTYILKPILWIGLAFMVWYFPHIKANGYLKLRKTVYLWALNFAVIYILICFMVGMLDALGKSPYNHSSTGILTNIVFVGSMLVGREFVRSYLINSFTKEENYLVFVLISLLMTFTNISIIQYTNLQSLKDAVEFVAEYLAPEFVQNLFVGYLVFLAGPLASIIYLGIIEGFMWLSPILPDLKWIIKALVGILCPIFFMMSLQNIYYTASKQIKRGDVEEESTAGWVVTSMVSILIVWFAVGVFPIYPSVIATGSMEPDIKPGDVILVEKIADMDGINSLNVGDIIQFERDGILISHRIMEIQNDKKEGISFITKGDNNSGKDSDPVKPEKIKGQIVKTIPKIGWPTLFIKSNKDIPLDKIEF